MSVYSKPFEKKYLKLFEFLDLMGRKKIKFSKIILGIEIINLIDFCCDNFIKLPETELLSKQQHLLIKLHLFYRKLIILFEEEIKITCFTFYSNNHNKRRNEWLQSSIFLKTMRLDLMFINNFYWLWWFIYN